MSRETVGLAIPPPSEYDEEVVVASVNSFINNLDMIDYLILNQLARKKLAPYRLIKKRAENERTIIMQTHSQVHSKHFIHGISDQIISRPTLYTSLTSHSKN